MDRQAECLLTTDSVENPKRTFGAQYFSVAPCAGASKAYVDLPLWISAAGRLPLRASR
jgi:hypothetical protein